jgi:RNA polymerase sigma factor (sigma-70 family)
MAPLSRSSDASLDRPEDFDALFTREWLPMVRVATLLVGSAHVAEEVVQDAFAAVDQRWDQLDRRGGYLRVSVVNGSRAVLRRRAVEQRYRSPAEEIVADDAPGRLVELSASLSRLSERQRIVIVLRYVADLPDEEIARILGSRPSTVRSLARRALAVLRKEWM